MSEPKRIILIKHGETRENLQGIHQGQGIGGTLSSNGAADVSLAGRALAAAGILPERVLYSPRSRCCQSADLLRLQFTEAAFQEERRLDAKNSGHLSGRPREAAAEEAARSGIPIHQLRAPGGESSEDVQARYVALLQSVCSAESSPTALLGHGGGLACLLLWLTGNGFHRYWDYVPGSGAVTLIEASGTEAHPVLVNVAPAALADALGSPATS